MSMSKSHFQKVLNHLRKISLSERDKGTRFEELTQYYLTHEPQYQDIYKEVYLWGEWAELKRIKKNDTGTDLIAITHDKEIHAIQCKFYADDSILPKEDINSFVADSSTKEISNRLLVMTAADLNENAQDLLSKQKIPIQVLSSASFEQSSIDLRITISFDHLIPFLAITQYHEVRSLNTIHSIT